MFSISVIGDSIVFGRGNNIDRGWVGRLRKYFEDKDNYNAVYNLGIPGDNTNDLLKRFDIEAKARIKYLREGDRHIIIFAIGINDSRYNNEKEEVNINQFDSNIKLLIEKAKKYTNEIYFIGLTPVDEKLAMNYENTSFNNKRIDKYNNFVKKNCQDFKIPFFDMFEKFLKLNHVKLLDDGVHPNFKGYEKMYEMIKKFLIESKVID